MSTVDFNIAHSPLFLNYNSLKLRTYAQGKGISSTN